MLQGFRALGRVRLNSGASQALSNQSSEGIINSRVGFAGTVAVVG